MNADDKAVVDITLRLTLRRGYWTNPDTWDWMGLLGLSDHHGEDVSVLEYKGVSRIFADGSVMEA